LAHTKGILVGLVEHYELLPIILNIEPGAWQISQLNDQREIGGVG
jgi:hypothetical protein